LLIWFWGGGQTQGRVRDAMERARDPTRVTVQIQPDRSHLAFPSSTTPTTRENCGSTTPTDPLAAQPGESQGAATDSSDSGAHRRKRPAHDTFSRRPVRPCARTVVRDPDRGLGRIFMSRFKTLPGSKAATNGRQVGSAIAQTRRSLRRSLTRSSSSSGSHASRSSSTTAAIASGLPALEVGDLLRVGELELFHQLGDGHVISSIVDHPGAQCDAAVGSESAEAR
jgi:hypothetical protein